MKCLSIRQPWAWLIIHGGKDIENRDWPCGYRGPLLIHAAKTKPTKADMESAVYFAQRLGVTMPEEQLEYGGIIGKVEMFGCVRESDSPWFFGTFGFQLRDPVAMQFAPYRGQLGLFDVNIEGWAKVSRGLGK